MNDVAGINVREFKESKPLDVLWMRHRIFERASINMIQGMPDEGKGLVTLDVVARVSRGAEWPEGGRAPCGDCFILSAEEGHFQSLTPKLLAAGANMENIHEIVGYGPDNNPISLVDHLKPLEDLIAKYPEPVLLTIDPLNSYVPHVNTHRDADFRSLVLTPLANLAEELTICVLIVMHVNQSVELDDRFRSSGNSCVPAACRCAFKLEPDPDDEERHLLLPVKINNLSKEERIGLAFRFEGVEVEGCEKQFPRVVWETKPISPDEFMRKRTTALSRAVVFLTGTLAPGRMLVEEILKLAKNASVSSMTLRRAREALGVVIDQPKREKGHFGQSWWVLPASAQGLSYTPGLSNRSNTPENPVDQVEITAGGVKNADSQLINRSNDQDNPVAQEGCIGGQPALDHVAVRLVAGVAKHGCLPGVSQGSPGGQPFEG